MKLPRRAFVHALGVGGAGLLSGAFVSARGREALVGAGRDVLDAGWSEWMSGLEEPRVIRLSTNENPNGPGERALDAIRAAFGDACRYPSAYASSVTAAVAAHLGVGEDHLVFGCGSGEVLRMATLACTSASKALVSAAPTFEDPERVAQAMGHLVRSVRVDASLRLDLAGMADQAVGAGLVFFCNPNNPTGTVHGADVVADFIRTVNRRSPETTILVDEAYHEYVDDPSYRTAIPLALENPRVIVSRTFSKVYGMAGLRLGYGVGRKEALDRLRVHRLGNNVNVLAAAAGIAGLADTSRTAREVRLNADAREYTRRTLAEMGFPSLKSEANFIMVDIRRDVKTFQDGCRKLGVAVGRTFPPLLSHARISIGTMDEMRQAVDVFRRVLGTSTASGG